MFTGKTRSSSQADAVGTRTQLPLLVAADPGATVVANDDAVMLAMRIRAHLVRARIQVVLTDNRHTMISVRRRRVDGMADYDVRLHRVFLTADGASIRALARYIAHNDRDSSRVLGAFIERHVPPASGRRVVSVPLVAQGDVHDLGDIYSELNQQYFAGSVDAQITWGPRLIRPRRRMSIKMGSYTLEDRIIRIHRSLDRAFVPRFFVAWVVYHEMLHQVHGVKQVGRRREFHSAAFREDERKYEHYRLARAWERAHLDVLLTC